jgi:hypothetical protein
MSTKTSAYYSATASEGWTRANALRIRARAWTGYPVGTVLVHVRPDGAVCAWDSVACHWTTCHSLSPRAIAKARALAAA